MSNLEILGVARGAESNKCIALLNEDPSLVNAIDQGVTVVHIAALASNCSLLKSLTAFKQGFKHADSSLLHAAIKGGCIKCVGIVLYEFGVPVDSLNEEGLTPLFTACGGKQTPLLQFLLEHGANPNVRCGDLGTPLHVAALNGEVEDIRVLLGFGADSNAQNKAGVTPLDVAKTREKANAAVTKELSKPQKNASTRQEDASRFKVHGNKVFAEGENVKAAKFYSQAILNDQLNHVYFSNRAACHFNLRDYDAAYLDACRCIALSPKFVRGYFRKAAAQNALKNAAGARKTIADGLAVEANNKDLLTLLDQINRN